MRKAQQTDMGKIRVGILFGGKSAEHEVSLQSARNVYDAIDRSRYEPVLIGIDKTGRWFLNDASRFLLNPEDPKRISLKPGGEPVTLVPRSGGALSGLGVFREAGHVDVIFPILHGPFGEDGTVQGLLKLADIPFVGSSVLGSAVGMDKDVMKRLLRDSGIPIGKFLVFRSHEAAPSFGEVKKILGMPIFIKPANMGSSVGISKVHNEDEFYRAVAEAFQYDAKIILEEFIEGRELECAVLGNEAPAASVPGEIISSHEFYSYDAKYLDKNGAALVIPANLDEMTKKKVRELAIKTFQVLDCRGLSRVDFFLRNGEAGASAGPGRSVEGRIIVNEINTMPGFTRISMYPKLWEASGVGYTELISRLIDLALEEFEREKRLKTSYEKF
ncbi:MAG: D-alanine--D-alanine ligase [Treponema sp.]|jgi:D-alanine-D-alanine ligase|nr:D-alanine--D-alanine ligase [Treponema sp.]